MTEREAFIRSICEQPEDDLRRLAFADWLDENGENRFAKYIRDSIADTSGGQYTAPSEMARESRPFFDIPKGVVSVQIRRGFISHIACSEKQFIRHAKRLFSNHPITSVFLRDKGPVRTFSGLYQWLWRSKPSQFADSIYSKIWQFLPDTFIEVHCRLFHNAADAMNGLSRACVNYGRSLAGLPPLRISPSLPATST